MHSSLCSNWYCDSSPTYSILTTIVVYFLSIVDVHSCMSPQLPATPYLLPSGGKWLVGAQDC